MTNGSGRRLHWWSLISSLQKAPNDIVSDVINAVSLTPLTHALIYWRRLRRDHGSYPSQSKIREMYKSRRARKCRRFKKSNSKSKDHCDLFSGWATDETLGGKDNNSRYFIRNQNETKTTGNLVEQHRKLDGNESSKLL